MKITVVIIQFTTPNTRLHNRLFVTLETLQPPLRHPGVLSSLAALDPGPLDVDGLIRIPEIVRLPSNLVDLFRRGRLSPTLATS